ncbi:thiamine biosynthesis protein ApbE [Novosphingobium fuchskuhlense]|uniref:FAD:protein FMN transferase n=1 Tax=Novosphingobium fuchskuhlense TaxID=1117702 RepID=A0A124JVF9_9SPHN|nr:FAD:protein FMN transferase [Novosphingobium fuchskuhlense]KUR72227.1 thiamine biosynthesis protein ApbE [Novosphingobium fuchskuhlense]
MLGKTAKPAGVHKHRFTAMGTPCEVQVETRDSKLGARLARIGEAEARRIEEKYTRYKPTGVVWSINNAGGQPVEVDEETAGLLDYAAQVHALSEGRFDITSGVLRRAWKFDGSDRVPEPPAVDALMPLIGWRKVGWERPRLTLPPGMEIDLGGICKEYAVDRAAMAILAAADAPVLVNFGGDLRTTRAKAGSRWAVAIESLDPAKTSGGLLQIGEGAVATSGDAKRFLLKDGKRYSHILDPRTGWPVEGPPRSVTVAARTCVQAGTLSTLAMLLGPQAETFLKAEKAEAWVLW